MEKLMNFIKRPQVWGFFLSVAILAIVSLAFFYPDNFEGNSLRQPDMQQGAAIGHEGAEYQAQTGEKALWTNSIFGGMPTFQISPSYPSNSLFDWLNSVYGLGLPSPSDLLFMMMFGFLILLFTLKMRWYYALIGALMWGFSSYFIIIIGAGHIWKFVTLAYVPPTIAGLIMLYNRRYVAGAAVLALFAMLQLNANHPQMSYYFGIVMALIAVAYLIDALRNKDDRKKELLRWLAASGLALASGALAVGANLPSLYNTYEYAKETKRAQSELTPLTTGNEQQAQERPTGGMPKEQIVGWSYGRSEMFSLLVPNIKGGASARPEAGEMTRSTLAKLDGAEKFKNTAPAIELLTQYFNESEGTNGPVYVGIIVFALFLVGCFIVKGPLKWAMIAATVISVVLALGRNAEGITDFMIYNFPLYNKFRAVESILVVAEFAIPFLAVLALAQIIAKGREAWKEYRTPIYIGFGVPALVCALAVIAPTIFGEPVNDNDRAVIEQALEPSIRSWKQQGATDAQIQEVVYQYSLSNKANLEAVSALRLSMVRTDGLRSFMFLTFAFVFLALYMAGKLKKGIAVGAVGNFVLIDLYGVDKRYVSHSSFGPADSPDGKIVFTPDAIDNLILQDTTAHYRVFDIPGFMGPDRSYFHKTLGGYHAAKLNRYDDLIQRKLMPAVQYGYFAGDPELDNPELGELGPMLKTSYAVADMLNGRYVITGDPQQPLVLNDSAQGNAWFVDKIKWVDNADEEMAALDVRTLDLRHEAVADRRFADVLPAEAPSLAPGDTIFLTSYTPNRLTYHASTTAGGVGVFSEVYFPWGWKADVDGKPVSLARVNYVLRAMAIPAGSHTVTMTFDPDSLHTTSAAAYACVTLIYLLLLGGVFTELRRCRLF